MIVTREVSIGNCFSTANVARKNVVLPELAIHRVAVAVRRNDERFDIWRRIERMPLFPILVFSFFVAAENPTQHRHRFSVQTMQRDDERIFFLGARAIRLRNVDAVFGELIIDRWIRYARRTKPVRVAYGSRCASMRHAACSSSAASTASAFTSPSPCGNERSQAIIQVLDRVAPMQAGAKNQLQAASARLACAQARRTERTGKNRGFTTRPATVISYFAPPPSNLVSASSCTSGSGAENFSFLRRNISYLRVENISRGRVELCMNAERNSERRAFRESHRELGCITVVAQAAIERYPAHSFARALERQLDMRAR